MKKLLFLLVLVVLFSCSKDREIQCWSCRWEMKMLKVNIYRSTIRDTCITEREVNRYEDKGTFEDAIKKERVMCWKQGDPPIPNPGF